MRTLILGAKATLCALALAQLGDVLSTNSAIASGNAQETNPLMALSMSHLGALWWLPKAALALWLLYQAIDLQAITRRQTVVLATIFKIYAFTLLSNTFHWL